MSNLPKHIYIPANTGMLSASNTTATAYMQNGAINLADWINQSISTNLIAVNGLIKENGSGQAVIEKYTIIGNDENGSSWSANTGSFQTYPLNGENDNEFSVVAWNTATMILDVPSNYLKLYSHNVGTAIESNAPIFQTTTQFVQAPGFPGKALYLPQVATQRLLMTDTDNGVIATSFSPNNVILQNGNSFGANMLIGTNDNFPLALETNGVTRLTVSASGNVGIGTSSPATNLEVSGSTTQQIRVNMLGQGDLRMISDTGYVGISSEGNIPIIFKVNSTGKSRIDSYGLDIEGVITTKNTGIDVYKTEPLSSSPNYITVKTNIAYVNEKGFIINVKGYGYGNITTSDFNISSYFWAGLILSQTTGITNNSLSGFIPPSVRLGFWNDNGTLKLAIEINNDSRYFSSFYFEVINHMDLVKSDYENWSHTEGAFDGTISGVVSANQSINSPIISTSTKRIGIGTITPETKIDIIDSTNAFAAKIQGSGGTNFVAIGTVTGGAAIAGYTANFGALANLTLQPTASGTVTIGTVTPQGGNILTINGSIAATSSSISVWSDKDAKDNIAKYEYGLKEILQIEPVRFKYKKSSFEDVDTTLEHVGIIAQDIEKIMPETVSTYKVPQRDEKGNIVLDKKGNPLEKDMKSFKGSTDLVYGLINAVKELNNRIEALEASLKKNNK